MSLHSSASANGLAEQHRPSQKPPNNYWQWHSSALVRLRRTRIFDYNRAFETVLALHSMRLNINRRVLQLLVSAVQRLIDQWHTLHAYGEQFDRELLASQAAAAAQVEARRLSEARRHEERSSVELKAAALGAKRRLFTAKGKGRRGGGVQNVYGTRLLSKIKADAAAAARRRRLGIPNGFIGDMKRSLRSEASREKKSPSASLSPPASPQLNGAARGLSLNGARVSIPFISASEEHAHPNAHSNGNGNQNALPHQNGDAALAPEGASLEVPAAARAVGDTPLVPVIVMPFHGVRSRFDRTRATPELLAKLNTILRDWSCALSAASALLPGAAFSIIGGVFVGGGCGTGDTRSQSQFGFNPDAPTPEELAAAAAAAAAAAEEKPVPREILALRPPRKHEPGFGRDPVTGERIPTIEKQHLFDTRAFRVLHERYGPPPPKRVRPLCPLTYIYGGHATLNHPYFDAPQHFDNQSSNASTSASAMAAAARSSRSTATSSAGSVFTSSSIHTASPATSASSTARAAGPQSPLYCMPLAEASSSTPAPSGALQDMSSRRLSLPMPRAVGAGARAQLDAQLSSLSDRSDASDPTLNSRAARLLRRAQLVEPAVERGDLTDTATGTPSSSAPGSPVLPAVAETETESEMETEILALEPPESLSPQRQRRMSTNMSLACMLSSMKQQCGARPGTRAFDRLRSASPGGAEDSAPDTEAEGGSELLSIALPESLQASPTRRLTRLAAARAATFSANPLTISGVGEIKRGAQLEPNATGVTLTLPVTPSRSTTPLPTNGLSLSVSPLSSGRNSPSPSIPSRNSSSSQATRSSSTSYSNRATAQSVCTRSAAGGKHQTPASASASASASALVVTPASLEPESPRHMSPRRAHQVVPSSRRPSSSSSTTASSSSGGGSSNKRSEKDSSGPSYSAHYSLRRSTLLVALASAASASCITHANGGGGAHAHAHASASTPTPTPSASSSSAESESVFGSRDGVRSPHSQVLSSSPLLFSACPE